VADGDGEIVEGALEIALELISAVTVGVGQGFCGNSLIATLVSVIPRSYSFLAINSAARLI